MIKYSRKRFTVIFCTLLFIILSPLKSSAQEVEGYWKLVDTWVYEFEYGPQSVPHTHSTGSAGEVILHAVGNEEAWPGFAASIAMRWDAPPESLIPGIKYSIPFSVEVVHHQQGEIEGAYYNPTFGMQTKRSTRPFSELEECEGKGVPSGLWLYRLFEDDTSTDIGNVGAGIEERFQQPVVRGPVRKDFTFTATPIYEVGERNRRPITYAIEVAFGSLRNGHRVYTYAYRWQYGSPPAFVGVSSEDETDTAIKATALPKQVRPDGESTVDITATLYEYLPGDDASSTPLVGETVTFEISEIEGIRPGRLSSETAVTEGDGIARLTYTAPTADELKTIEEFRRHNITVKVRSEKHNVEDLAYITIRPQLGKAFIEPSIDGLLGTTYGGSRGIVPPDGRFPAMIRAVLEDENMKPLKNTEVTVTILSEEPVGMIRSIDGAEAVTLDLVTDDQGRIEAHYFYALETPPEVPVTETIQITSDFMTAPLEVEALVGLNIVIDNVESAYEGRGVVSAGENIPLRIRVKDVWNPDIDLSEIITYWGLGDGTGDTRLFMRLEIDNISSIPEYVMDHFRQTFYPEPPFDQRVEIISSERLAQKNLLWVPDYSLLPYRGYPRVRPVATGNHYYEARISLVDHHGEVVFETDYPATKGFFNLHTDMPADEVYLYFVNNPLRPQTEEDEYLAIALKYLGAGCLISVVDALDAINRGDTDALFGIMFFEIREFFVKQAKQMSPDFKKMMTWYSRLSLAEQVYEQANITRQIDPGKLEQSLMRQLEGAFTDDEGQLVILKGTGDQELMEFPAYEGELYYDAELGAASLKAGTVSYYIVPPNMELTSKTAKEMIIY